MTQEDFKNNIEGAVNDFVDGIATRGQLFSAIMNTILQMEKERPPTIKVRIERQDNLEGFAAYLTPSLTQDGTAIVLMNVEATFHAAAANNESPVDFMIENVMHEVGHALQEFFGKEFSEEQVEGIVEKYRERYLPDVGAKTVLSPAGHGERMELLLRISAQKERAERRATMNSEQVKDGNIIEFLCGEKPFDGVWFSEIHPTERGAFWWRKHLRQFTEALSTQPTASAEELWKKHSFGNSNFARITGEDGFYAGITEATEQLRRELEQTKAASFASGELHMKTLQEMARLTAEVERLNRESEEVIAKIEKTLTEETEKHEHAWKSSDMNLAQIAYWKKSTLSEVLEWMKASRGKDGAGDQRNAG